MTTEDTVEEILQRFSPQVRELVEPLRRLVRDTVPEATERGYRGWGNIIYNHNGDFCYIGPQKRWVNLGFPRGVDLPDPEGLLEGTGKGMRHVKVRKPEGIHVTAFKALLHEACKISRGRMGGGQRAG